jgi:hypothetical protein
LPWPARHTVCNGAFAYRDKRRRPLAFRINVEERHVVGTESPVIADLPVGADARRQRSANVSEGEGFWTPALAGRSCAMRGRSSKPPKEETAGRKDARGTVCAFKARSHDRGN